MVGTRKVEGAAEREALGGLRHARPHERVGLLEPGDAEAHAAEAVELRALEAGGESEPVSTRDA